MTKTRVRTALLGSAAAIAMMAASVPASADDIGDLRAQIDAMKAKVATLEADKVQKRRVAAAQSVGVGSKPKSWLLPGTNTSMNIGGYAKLDILYDFNGFLGTAYGPTGVPLRGSTAAQRDGNFRFHAQQSRIWVKTWTPTDWGELATHIEADFFNSHANSGNPIFRLRHAYGRLGPVLAGRTWTTFMPIFYLSETIDFGGPTGVLFVRQAMLRYTHAFGSGTQLIAAIEDPSKGAGASQTLNSSNLNNSIASSTSGPNYIPDFVLALHHRFSRGGIYISALLRGLESNGANGAGNVNQSDRTIGWGLSAAGVYRITNRFIIGGSLGYGQGQAKYLSGVDTDAVLNSNAAGTSVTLDAVTSWSATGYVQFKWTPTIRSNVALGYAYEDVADETTGGKAAIPLGVTATAVDHWNWSLHANVIWSPVPQVNFGIEYIYAFRSVYNGANGVGNRIQIGMQYKF